MFYIVVKVGAMLKVMYGLFFLFSSKSYFCFTQVSVPGLFANGISHDIR